MEIQQSESYIQSLWVCKEEYHMTILRIELTGKQLSVLHFVIQMVLWETKLKKIYYCISRQGAYNACTLAQGLLSLSLFLNFDDFTTVI